jgi:hypothetical protein
MNKVMNREIKFRIWNILESKWNGKYGENPRLVGELCCKDGIYAVPESYSRNLVVQQYTGLTDQNEREIYAGDIVDIISDGYSPIRGAVTWDYLNAAFLVHGRNGVGPVGIYGCEQSVVVVGNIYENPELLNA